MSTVTDQDLLSPELTEDPFAYYAELRANDPVHWAPASRAWLVTRYDDVVAAFGDPRLSSDRVRPLLGVLPAERRAEYGPMLEVISRWMVVTDPPVHTRLNRLASRAFRQQRVSAMSGWIGELVDELLDDFVAAGDDDFLAGLAYPLPAAVIARMMGVLRFEGPIKILIRWVVEDHERDGRPVRAGDRVFLVLQSANRDEGTFSGPDRFDIGRPAKPLHVGFGRGVHACLGAQLARIEARVALPRILDRLGPVRVLGDVTWRPNIASRAVTGLRIG